MGNLSRAITSDILASLKTNPAVFLNGPRQAGKSTLSQQISSHLNGSYITLDDIGVYSNASADEEGFLRNFEHFVVIDEIQMLPRLFRLLKLIIDQMRYKEPQKANGRFLLTGSANLMTLPQLSDAMLGRMAIYELWPFSFAESKNSIEGFIDYVFTKRPQFQQDAFASFDLASALRAATFPQISLHNADTNQWYRDYLNIIIQRDVRNIMEIEKIGAFMQVIKLLATRAATLVNDSAMASEVKLNNATYLRYKTLLSLVFIVFNIKSWHNNLGKRLVKSSKLFFTDTGLLTYLLGVDAQTLKQRDSNMYGRVLENFVASELMKQISRTNDNYSLYHFRTHDQKEVDFIIERKDGSIVAIEVKAKSSPVAEDYKHLALLQETLGDKFVAGIILHQGNNIMHFNDKLYSAPIASLWNFKN